MSSKPIAAPEWLPLYQARWYSWVFISIYSLLLATTMAGFFISVLGLGAASLFVDTSLRGIKWYVLLPFTALAGWLSWLTVKAVWAQVLDLFRPVMFEGRLVKLDLVRIPTKNWGYDAWILKAGAVSWELDCSSVPDKYQFKHKVLPGSIIRITYRGGSNVVTGLWVQVSPKN